MYAATASDEGIACFCPRAAPRFKCLCVRRRTLAPTIGYDNAARIAKAAHLKGTSLREEALVSGLVDAAEFDALVRPEAMLAPYD
jgi:aspartate ammonia-lyase